MLYDLFYFVALPFNLLMSVIDYPLHLISVGLDVVFSFIVSVFTSVVAVGIFLLYGALNGHSGKTGRSKPKERMAMGSAVDENDPTTPMRF